MYFFGIIVLIALTGLINLLAFFFGAMITQQAYEGKQIKIERPEPKEIREHKKEQMLQRVKEESDMAKNMRNLDNYTGDALGQEDF